MENNYEEFYSAIRNAAERFKKWEKSETIQIISHLDADGISSCAILTKTLNEENRKYTITILPQLNRDKIKEIAEKEYRYIIFADFGSGQVKDIKELLNDKEVIILDHHEPEKEESDNICHVNPHLFGIDGSKEISGAGVLYFFAKAVDKKNESLAHVAIVGAIGDIQEDKGFLRLNKEILDTAIEKGKIRVKKSLRLFGMQTRPLHKVLEYCSDPYIPDVSGSESGAVQFLHQIGIEPKIADKWIRVIDWNEEEMQKLIAGIIMKRIGEGKDTAAMAKFLLTEESSWITGQIIGVDGGRSTLA